MIKDIQIGKESKGYTWVRVFALPQWFYDKYGLSENRDSFTGSGVFHVYFHINKETVDGKRLVELLQELDEVRKNNEVLEPQIIKKIAKHIEKFTFKHLTLDDMVDIIEEVQQDFFRKGQEAKIEEFKSIFHIKKY